MTALERVALFIRPDRKGHGLLLMAAVWAVIGLGIPGAPVRLPGAWHQQIPDTIAAGAWLATAGFAAVAAWWVRPRPLAIGALVLMPSIRLASYITSWALYLSPGPPPGYDRAWLGAAQQALMIAFVFYVASEKRPRNATVADLHRVLGASEDQK